MKNDIYCSKNAMKSMITEYIKPVNTIIDVGVGIRPQKLVEPKIHICVEPCQEYIDILQKTNNSKNIVLMNATWDIVLNMMPVNSVDTVIALDFIEHLDKAQGKKFIERSKIIAREQVVLFTPLGYYPQSYTDNDNRDRWGLSGAKWQQHKSGWLPEEFGEQWKCVVCKEYHCVDQKEGRKVGYIGAFWAVYNSHSEYRKKTSILRSIRNRAKRLL